MALTLQHIRFSLFPPSYTPGLALAGGNHQTYMDDNNNLGEYFDNDDNNESNSHIWLAVPKSRVSKSRKRIKNHLKRTSLKVKDNIIVDGRTGELTLRHHLPLNWKNYLPDENIRPFSWDDFLPARQQKICKLRPFKKRNSDQLFMNKSKK